jgi:hypothetical protein
MPKLLIGAGIVLILVGLVWLNGERFGLGRLPGDIMVAASDAGECREAHKVGSRPPGEVRSRRSGLRDARPETSVIAPR